MPGSERREGNVVTEDRHRGRAGSGVTCPPAHLEPRNLPGNRSEAEGRGGFCVIGNTCPEVMAEITASP